MDDAQKRLKSHSNIIIDSLNEAVERKKLEHIGKVFTGHYGRLFFDIAISDELTKIFQNNEVLAGFEKKFDQWEPVVNKKNIRYLKKLVEYFFKPLEQSEEWQEFWQEQKKLIPKEQQKEIRDLIAVGVAYKIQCLWAIENAVRMSDRNQIDKVSCFTMWINGTVNNEIKEKQLQKTRRMIENALTDFKTGLLNIGDENQKLSMLSKQEIYPKLMEQLQSIRRNIHFKAISESEEILQEGLVKLVDDMLLSSKQAKSKVDKYCLKKLSEAILMDINIHHLVRFRDVKTADFLMNSVGKVEHFIGSKVKEQCARLLKNYKIQKYQAARTMDAQNKKSKHAPLLPTFFHSSLPSKEKTLREKPEKKL